MSQASSGTGMVAKIEDKDDAINADTGMAGVLIQQLLPDLLNLLYDKELPIRQSALKLITHVLKRALVHPITCVSHLVALQGDHHPVVATRAFRALQLLIEKDSKLVLSRLGDGILACYKFQVGAFNGLVRPLVESTKGSLTFNESILSLLYVALRGTKTSRQGFLYAIIRLFETESENVHFLKFLTRILITLSYGCQEEILYVIHHINRLTSYTGASLISTLKSHYAHSKALPSEPTKAMPGIMFLLRAKRFLKSFYNLSSAKCQSYDTNEVKQNPLTNKVPIENIDTSTMLSFDPVFDTEWFKDENSCHEVYVMLKKEMKNDEDDINVASIQTKTRKGPGRIAKRKNEDGDEEPKKKPRVTKKPVQTRRKKQTRKRKKDEDSEEEAMDEDYSD